MGESRGYHEIIEALDKLEAKDSSLPAPLQLYRKILSIQAEADKRINVRQPELSQGLIDESVRQGRPLLRFGDLDLDWWLVGELVDKATSIFSSYTTPPGELPGNLQHLTPAMLEEAARAWYEDRELSSSLAGAEDMVELAIFTALKPFLSRYAESLINLVKQEYWRRGYCPVCGGSPDFSYLDKERGARWLLCSRCDAQWLFQRLECQNCGNQDQTELSYFTDDKGLYRLNVCEKCRCYLKAIDLRVAEGEVFLPLERFLTMDLDRQAIEKGYTTCSQAGKLKRMQGHEGVPRRAGG